MKRDYTHPFLAHVDVEADNTILNGSYTCKPIKVQSVEVDDFDDGFSSLKADGDDFGFKDISFE